MGPSQAGDSVGDIVRKHRSTFPSFRRAGMVEAELMMMIMNEGLLGRQTPQVPNIVTRTIDCKSVKPLSPLPTRTPL
jgi:hypothetical protein